MAHDTQRIIDTISDATNKLADRLEKRDDYWTKGGDHTKTVKAVNEFVEVLLSNFAYTFSEDSDSADQVRVTHSEALTAIKERFENWL
tara:strand:- start:2375 stop:2638 length:264 start_codon:yes stop_codon:yes gene_type:complete